MPALHHHETIFSLRHGPSWVLLTMAAGAVNAGAFLACRRFVTHVTGTVSLLGMDSGAWGLMLDYAVVLACFIAGAMASVLAIDGRYHRGLAPLYALPLVIVAGLLSLVSLLGAQGLFGRFGGSVESLPDFAMLSLLSFAMASRTPRSPAAPARSSAPPILSALRPTSESSSRPASSPLGSSVAWPSSARCSGCSRSGASPSGRR